MAERENRSYKDDYQRRFVDRKRQQQQGRLNFRMAADQPMHEGFLPNNPGSAFNPWSPLTDIWNPVPGRRQIHYPIGGPNDMDPLNPYGGKNSLVGLLVFWSFYLMGFCALTRKFRAAERRSRRCITQYSPANALRPGRRFAAANAWKTRRTTA